MNWQFWRSRPLHIEVGKEGKAGSSTVTSSMFTGDWLPPKVSFEKQFEYYESIGKEQNVVEKLVAKGVSRDWSFEGVDKATAKAYTIPMDAWAEKFKLDRIIEYYFRNMPIAGNFIIGKSDWQPVQLSAIIGLQRDEFGNVQKYAKNKKNSISPEILDAKDFLHDKFIELDRQPWGLSLFHALVNDAYQDVDGEKPLSLAEIYRQLPQDFHKIIHKLGAPRIFYAFNDVDPAQLEVEAAKLTKLKPGHRAALNQVPEMIQEMVDGKARFTDHIDFISNDFEAGTGSSANRVITKPSAMADAREAGEQDDDLFLGIAAKFVRFMNDEVIPAVLGEEARGKVLFRWGSKEEYEFDSQEAKDWLDRGVIGISEVREMLRGRNIMKLDDTLYKKDQEAKQARQADMLNQQQPQQSASPSEDPKQPQKDKEDNG